MNFPIQACSACGEQTENLYCPNCRRKLTRDEIKVFWNPQSWAQYRATVLDFQSFSSSLPYLETRVLDSPPADEPPARKLGLLVAIVAAALVGLAALGLWFARVNAPDTKVEETAEASERGQNVRAKPTIAELRTRTPRPTPGPRTPRPGLAEPGRTLTSPLPQPGFDDVCGVGLAPPGTPLPDLTVEEVCGMTQPPGPPATVGPDDVSGHVTAPPPDPADEALSEEVSANAAKAGAP
jgi:hypothetical protein